MTDELNPEEISPKELKTRMEQGESLIILDVREPHELEICKIPHTYHIPLGDLRFRLEELAKDKENEIIVYCRRGRRSLMAAQFLLECGFAKVINLQGGMHAWSDDIDPSFEKY